MCTYSYSRTILFAPHQRCTNNWYSPGKYSVSAITAGRTSARLSASNSTVDAASECMLGMGSLQLCDPPDLVRQRHTRGCGCEGLCGSELNRHAQVHQQPVGQLQSVFHHQPCAHRPSRNPYGSTLSVSSGRAIERVRECVFLPGRRRARVHVIRECRRYARTHAAVLRRAICARLCAKSIIYAKYSARTHVERVDSHEHTRTLAHKRTHNRQLPGPEFGGTSIMRVRTITLRICQHTHLLGVRCAAMSTVRWPKRSN